MRLFLFDQRTQCHAIGHRYHMAAMCDLHARCVRVAIHCDHFATEALQGDDDFLAQLAAAKQHDARGRGRERSSYTDIRHLIE